MSPSRLFILRPVATSLLMAAIMLVGMVAYRFLPLSALPEVDYPTIQVQTLYPGASPDVMTSSVTSPLEVQLGQMPGLNQMSSVSSAGSSAITLQFSLALSLDVAEQEVQAAINASGNLLPSDLPAPPIYAKVNPADAPILTLGLTSKTLPLTEVYDLAESRPVGLPEPRDTVRQLTGFLDRHLDWLTRQDTVVDLFALLKDLTRQLRPVTGDPSKRIGSCPNVIDQGSATIECGAPLYAPIYGDTIRCWACHREWPAGEWTRLADILESA